jgi:alkaline phosphatase D
MRIVYLFLFLCFTQNAIAQSTLVAGPMAGYVDSTSARIWVEVQSSVSVVALTYWPKDHAENKNTVAHEAYPGKISNTVTLTLNNLQPGTTYEYDVSAGIKPIASGMFKTQPTATYPDFIFLTGSCAANVMDTSIFTSMAHTPADLMIWLGDNWYLPDNIPYKEILWNGARSVRAKHIMQPLLKAMPHYAIWDDHDFGPNNADKYFPFKEDSRSAFMDYWANPSYGNADKGIYTSFSYGDVNFYLLDDRWWRNNDKDADHVGLLHRKPNPNKLMFGREQMQWLEKQLKESKATFNIIATGSQMLNAKTRFDCFYHYPIEYNELLNFISENNIHGIVFLTGDRHHSEIIRLTRKNDYSLYDITISPFTSHPDNVKSELNNPLRVPGTYVGVQNYAQVRISGDNGNRKLHVNILGVKGETLATWETTEKELNR